MNTWDIGSLELRPRSPEIRSSTQDARAIALEVSPPQSWGDQQVHERAWVAVVDGELEFVTRRGRAWPEPPAASADSSRRS